VSNAYHLDLLVKETARQAIQEPARQFGFGYENSLYDKSLMIYARKCASSNLPIYKSFARAVGCKGRPACSELLQKANIGDLPHEAEYALVELEVYQNLDGAAGILKPFYWIISSDIVDYGQSR